jgi:hypothetical protein
MARGSAGKPDKSDSHSVESWTARGVSKTRVNALLSRPSHLCLPMGCKKDVCSSATRVSARANHAFQTINENFAAQTKPVAICHNCGPPSGYLPIRRTGYSLRTIFPVLAVPDLCWFPLSCFRHDTNQRQAVMDNGGNYNGDDDETTTPRLPAVIPPPRVPIVIPLLKRVAIPYWSLIVVAIFGSVAAGALAATVWPWNYHSKTSRAVTTLPRSNDVVNPGSVADNAVEADEVTKIDLSPVSLNPAGANSGGLNTLNLSPANLNTTDQNVVNPFKVEPPPPPAGPPPAQIAQDACHVNSPKPQIVMNPPRTVLPADEPASLGLTVDGPANGAYFIICGYAARSVFSVGHAVGENTWTIPASMIAEATIMPPHGFAGPMDLAVTLMNIDRSLADRKTVHLQWRPQARPAPQALPVPRREFANHDPLLTYGSHLKAIGNLIDARQIFSRVAQSGDPRGAFLLAETYDPISLAKHQLLPKDSDLELARVWYRKASDLGSPDAAGRLERLTNW